MKTVIVTGSHQANSQSLKVAKFMAAEIRGMDKANSVDVLDLGGAPLAAWHADYFKKDSELWKSWQPISKMLLNCDSLVVVTPEWHGMVPAALKNFFLLCGVAELAHKPALIVSISTSVGGTYPVSELRMSSYKNNRLCYLPEHLIMRDVDKTLNGPEVSEHRSDIYIRPRLSQCLQLLREYSLGLTKVREAAVFDFKVFPNGM